jgi:tripartite-type tricarboxylate transporter receptor subunit TctC
MMPRVRRAFASAATACLLLAATGCQSGTTGVPPAEFFSKKTIEFVVPYGPGGGYDLYVRDIAPYLARCTHGDVTVINEAGAGGLLATSQTAVADPDGLRVQIVNTVGAVSAELGEAEGLNFELSELSWLARVSSEANVVVVAADSKFRTFDDLRNAPKPVKFVSTGPGSNDYVNPPLLSRIFDFPVEVITGFSGSGEARTAYLRGDADAQVLPLTSVISAIRAGEIRPLLTIGKAEDALFANVPKAGELPLRTEEQRRILSALLDLVATSRTVVAPPHMDPARLQSLREAFRCALTNSELVARSTKQRRPIEFLPGEDTGRTVNSLLHSDPAFRAVLRESA